MIEFRIIHTRALKVYCALVLLIVIWVVITTNKVCLRKIVEINRGNKELVCPRQLLEHFDGFHNIPIKII